MADPVVSSIRRTVSWHYLHCKSTAGDSFSSCTSTNMSNSWTYFVAFFVVWIIRFAVIITDGSFDLGVVSCFLESNHTKLLSPQ